MEGSQNEHEGGVEWNGGVQKGCRGIAKGIEEDTEFWACFKVFCI